MTSVGVAGRIETLASLQARMLAPILREAGMGLPTFLLLSHLAAGGGSARQADLVQDLGVAPATLSESIKDHVEKGLITQGLDGHDRRVRTVSLTSQGRSVLARVAPHLRRMDALYSEVLTSAEAEALLRLLDKAASGILRLAGEG